MVHTVDGVVTNLTSKEFFDVQRALDSGETVSVPGTGSVVIGSAGELFDYKGSRYELSEQFERLATLHRVPPDTKECGFIPVVCTLAEMP